MYLSGKSHNLGNWWLGASDLDHPVSGDSEGTFYWASSDPVKTLDIANWSPGEPNNFRHVDVGDEDCVEVDGGNGKWNDNNCRWMQ